MNKFVEHEYCFIQNIVFFSLAIQWLITQKYWKSLKLLWEVTKPQQLITIDLPEKKMFNLKTCYPEKKKTNFWREIED